MRRKWKRLVNDLSVSAASSDFQKPRSQVIEPEEVRKCGVTALHTTHCSPEGEILISCMGDLDGNPLGDFLVLDETTCTIKGEKSVDHSVE